MRAVPLPNFIAPMLRLSLLCLLLLTAGCRQEEPDAPDLPGSAETPDAPEDHAGLTADSTVTEDSTGLLLADRLPLGATVRQVREVLPASQMAEDTLRPDRQAEEATAPYNLFGRPGEVEMNFEDGRLGSYFFRLDSLDCASADSLYARVQTAYGERYGAPQEETQDEGGYRARSSFWRADTVGVSATRGEQAGECRLAWGFQTEMP